METIKNISLFIVLGIIIVFVSDLLKSQFLTEFLKNNLLLILIALMAINTTTISVVMTKLKDIYDKYGGDFALTIKELKLSLVEQVSLIIAAVIVFTLEDSALLKSMYSFHCFTFDVLIYAIFFYSIYVLYDTANAIFVLLHFDEMNNNNNVDE